MLLHFIAFNHLTTGSPTVAPVVMGHVKGRVVQWSGAFDSQLKGSGFDPRCPRPMRVICVERENPLTPDLHI